MRRSFLEDFSARRREVRRYLQVLRRVEKAAAGRSDRELEDRRINVLRAGAFLALYNLVEASARGAVEAIHDEIKGRGAKFEELSDSLRREIVKGFKKRADADKHKDLRDLDLNFVREGLSVDQMFSGNVDSKSLKGIGEIYGFRTLVPAKTRDGADLLPIKTNRNDLAHGFKSFEEIGRAYPTRELLAIAMRATAYMAAILQNVDSYLDEAGYLLASQGADTSVI